MIPYPEMSSTSHLSGRESSLSILPWLYLQIIAQAEVLQQNSSSKTLTGGIGVNTASNHLVSSSAGFRWQFHTQQTVTDISLA